MMKNSLALSEQGLCLLYKMTNNELNVSLFSSLPCPVLSLFFSLLPRAPKHRKAHAVMLVSSTPQTRSLVTKFSKMAVFSSSNPSKLFGIPLVF